MTEFEPAIPDGPYGEMELIRSHGTDQFEKHRLRGDGVTVDVALVPMPADETDDYIADRKDELRTMHLDVPSPYRSEIDEEELDENHLVEFQDGEPDYGLGYADPEHRPILAEGDHIVRYRYLVTWRYIDDEEVLAEIEVYVPTDRFDRERARDLADAVVLDG